MDELRVVDVEKSHGRCEPDAAVRDTPSRPSQRTMRSTEDPTTSRSTARIASDDQPISGRIAVWTQTIPGRFVSKMSR